MKKESLSSFNFDKKFLKYQLQEAGISKEMLAKKFNITTKGIEYKFWKNAWNLEEIFILLEITGMKFEQLFKK